MLVNTITLERIWEHDFRALFPDTSFPATITSEMIADFGHSVLVYPTQPTAITGAKIIDAGTIKVGDEYQVDWHVVSETPEDTAARVAEVQRVIVEQVQARLDAFAQTRNYDGILSAATYATSAVPKFAAEGAYAVQARDAMWSALYTILAEVQAETRPMPTSIADIEADLPTLTWPA
jgi:hypothetical protein